MAFIHILPEAAEGYSEYVIVELGRHRVFPLPYVMAFFGYLIILLIDRVLSQSHASKQEPNAEQNLNTSKVTNMSEIDTVKDSSVDEKLSEKSSYTKQCCSGKTN